jgi:predicted Zn-dependent protease
MDRTHEALADYGRAVELDSGDDESRLRVAELLLALQRFEDAARHFEALQERQPDSPEVLYGLARVRAEKGKSKEAITLLERLLEFHKDHAGALAERGRLALEANDPAEAERWLRRAVHSAPFERDILHTFHQCLVRNGHADEAEKYQSRLSDIDADRKRLNQLKRDIAASPQEASLRCEMGRILLHNGQTKEGVRWLQSALRIDPRHRPSREALDELDREAGGGATKPQ